MQTWKKNEDHNLLIILFSFSSLLNTVNMLIRTDKIKILYLRNSSLNLCPFICRGKVKVMVFNSTFNNISVISGRRSVLLFFFFFFFFWKVNNMDLHIYLCIRGVDIASFDDFSVGFWNCSNSVVFFTVFFKIIFPFLHFNMIMYIYIVWYVWWWLNSNYSDFRF